MAVLLVGFVHLTQDAHAKSLAPFDNEKTNIPSISRGDDNGKRDILPELSEMSLDGIRPVPEIDPFQNKNGNTP